MQSSNFQANYLITSQLTQVFVGSEFSNSDILNYKSWDVTDLPPEEARKFTLEIILSFPGGFFLSMVGPLDFG